MDVLTTHRNPNIEQLRMLETQFASLYSLLEDAFQKQIPAGGVILDDMAEILQDFRRKTQATSRAHNK